MVPKNQANNSRFHPGVHVVARYRLVLPSNGGHTVSWICVGKFILRHLDFPYTRNPHIELHIFLRCLWDTLLRCMLLIRFYCFHLVLLSFILYGWPSALHFEGRAAFLKALRRWLLD